MDVEGQEKLVEEQGLEAGRNFGVGMTTVLATAVVWTAAACGARAGGVFGEAPRTRYG